MQGRAALQSAAVSTAAYVAALEVLVYSYFQREVLAVLFIALAAWPVLMPPFMRFGRGDRPLAHGRGRR